LLGVLLANRLRASRFHEEGVMQIQKRRLESSICLDVEGRLVTGVADRLKNEVHDLLRRGHRDIVLSLRDVSQIDTSGLTALIAVRSAVLRKKGTITLTNLPSKVHDLLVITRLITAFDVYELESELVHRLRRQVDA
jgi:anti-sigma B factor antagonist